jgi:NADPH-dependent 2,4-dienoyl-CoA reductase/sulfur reductase-like enzyme
MTRIVIVGAGPAGIAAAEVLCAGGHRPILIDEGQRVGGQGYRQPSSGLTLDMRRLMGGESGKYEALHARFDRIRSQIDYRPRTLVWAIDGAVLHLVCDGRVDVVEADALLLATGAMDRVAPLPGWTLPGVFTLGGAQVALKDQGCLIGHRVAFLGSSPLMLLAARQYREMGGEVAVVADTTPLSAKALALPQMLRAPRTLLRGLGYMAGTLQEGTPLLHGVTPLAIEGDGHVERVRLTDSAGRERRFACDAVALGHGLKPETQLADLAGAPFAYNADFRFFLPQTDGFGRSRPGLYLAGDGATIGGADAAEASGALAAHAILTDLGVAQDVGAIRQLARKVARLRSFQRGLARAFAWPVAQIRAQPDDTILCRCENITFGAVRNAMAQALGPVEVNRVKAMTRCGMGRCQGRVCGPALQEIVAGTGERHASSAGRLRSQAPVKPIALAAATDAAP